MHRRYLHDSIRRSADAAKRTPISRYIPPHSPQPFGQLGKRTYATSNPALKDTRPDPNDSAHIRGLPAFNVQDIVEGISQGTPRVAIKGKEKDCLDMEYTTQILDEGQYLFQGRFTPGTFVELRRNLEVTEGIVIREYYVHGWNCDVIMGNGVTMEVKTSSIHFAIPNFISSDLAARCGFGLKPENQSEVNARIEAIKSLRMFTVKTQQAMQGSRLWDRQGSFNLYDEVKSPDPTKWGQITLKAATEMLYRQPDFTSYYATHRYLLDRPLRFIAREHHYRTQTFDVRPEQHVQDILQVEKLLNEYRIHKNGGQYFRFIQKARKIVNECKTDLCLQTGPMQQVTTSDWNAEDEIFLRFLLRPSAESLSNQIDPYRTAYQTIIKDIAPTNNAPITWGAAHEVIVKLGIVAPWSSFPSLSRIVNPTFDLETPDPLKTTQNNIFAKSRQISGTVLGPYDMHAIDPLESVRQDFNGTVFVIDSAEARELDDGISVERIPSEPNNYWVHVHIADPARYLHPGHALSLNARKQWSTIYLTDKTYPLLPTDMMFNSKLGLSLSAASESNKAITFSIKVSESGEFLDYKMQASILRNVRQITYDDVDAALGIDTTGYITYPLGGAPSPSPAKHVNDADLADLRLLQKLSDARCRMLFDSNHIIPSVDNMQLSVQSTSKIRSPHLQGSKYEGFPDILYSVERPSFLHGSRVMVAEMMKLAGRAASCVARDHGVPVIRRGFTTDAETREEILALRNPNSTISQQQLLQHEVPYSGSTVSGKLQEHVHLLVPETDGYTKATSPLRRYSDLAVHWQMHHILLGKNAPRRLPFDTTDIESLSGECQLLETRNKRLAKLDSRAWALLAIKRYAGLETVNGLTLFPDTGPFSSLKAFIRSAKSSNYTFYVPELGLQAFAPAPDGIIHKPGDDVQVAIRSIQLGRQMKVAADILYQ